MKKRVWAVGVLSLSVGCGDPGGVSAPSAPPASAPVAVHHASGATAAPLPVEPSLEPPTAPAATTPDATDTVWCAGHATTAVTLAGNLDPAALVPDLPFDPQDAAYTSNFSTSMSVYDAWGRPAQVSYYFSKNSDFAWDFHVLLSVSHDAATPLKFLEIGTAYLTFESTGLQPRAYFGAPFKLSAPAGFETPEISFDFDKLTSLRGVSKVTEQHQNGNRAAFSSNCSQVIAVDAGPAGPEGLREQPLADFPACLTDETRSFYIALNFSQIGDTSQGSFWNASEPLQLPVTDRLGRESTLFVYFRGTADDDFSWTYRVFAAPDTGSPLVGAGELSFNSNGSLKNVSVSRTLHYVEPDGHVLDLGLDFGRGTDAGGFGVDGSTAFFTLPALVNLSARGTGPSLGLPCAVSTRLEPDMKFPDGFSLLGHPATRGVFSSGILPPSTPLLEEAFDPQAPVTTSSVATSQTIYDWRGRPWTLNMYARHVTPHEWQYTYTAINQFSSASVSTDLGLLEFDTAGRLLTLTPPTPFRLPLDDGSPGPLIDIPKAIDDISPESFLAVEAGDSGAEIQISPTEQQITAR